MSSHGIAAGREDAFEDPVAGSAHCYLGPFSADRLGKREMIGYQPSVRGGVVSVMLRGDRATLAGRSVMTLRGELTVAPA